MPVGDISKHSMNDFTHVTFSAADCLGDDEAPTYLRLDYQISHILLDEFQDTSINQYRSTKIDTRLV